MAEYWTPKKKKVEEVIFQNTNGAKTESKKPWRWWDLRSLLQHVPECINVTFLCFNSTWPTFFFNPASSFASHINYKCLLGFNFHFMRKITLVFLAELRWQGNQRGERKINRKAKKCLSASKMLDRIIIQNWGKKREPMRCQTTKDINLCDWLLC